VLELLGLARCDEGAYLQRAVTEKQRCQARKKQAEESQLESE